MPIRWKTSRKLIDWRRLMGASSRREWHRPRVIRVDPVRVGLLLQPRIRARGRLHARGTLLARRLEAAEGVGDAVAVDAIEAARQYGGVLDRHRRALRHVGRHRMAGIAEQGHLAISPLVERLP